MHFDSQWALMMSPMSFRLPSLALMSCAKISKDKTYSLSSSLMMIVFVFMDYIIVFSSFCV